MSEYQQYQDAKVEEEAEGEEEEEDAWEQKVPTFVFTQFKIVMKKQENLKTMT